MKWTITLCLLVAAAAAQAQTFAILASFTNVDSEPHSLIQAADGNFYGWANGPLPSSGPTATGPVIFEITPAGAQSTLYTFALDSNGATSLLQGSDGNFYGTGDPGTGSVHGAVFKLTPTGTFTPLHIFSGPDGDTPNALIQATDGNLYGTTQQGGTSLSATSYGVGTVFKVTPDGTLTTLHSFSVPDGSFPAGLIQATDGNLYGITEYGGAGCPNTDYPLYNGCGTVFKITTAGSLTTLHLFNGTDGRRPNLGLFQAADGNFYGTTDGSTIFEITPGGTLTTLYTFESDGPPESLMQAVDGNFYGTTSNGGGADCSSKNCGTLFQFTPTGTLTTVYSFGATARDAANPNPPIQASDGNLYGTTFYGGANQDGTFYKVSLPALDVPAIASSGGVLNGASFQPGIAADSWITISGTNLSSTTDTWNNAIVNGALPTTLDGVSVMVGDQAAYIEYISATQINAVAPSVSAGTVPVTVSNANGTSQAVMAQLTAEQPAFFQWGNYAVATRQNFSLAVKNGTFAGTTTVPAAPGDVIILWGTGFGPTSPSAPAGAETPSTTTYNTATAVSVTVGGKPATVYGAALAPGYAGLYQVAIQIPASLANGDYPLVATIAGVQSPSTTLITVQQ
jgi:uncharacterized protein (TIGR03437 family)